MFVIWGRVVYRWRGLENTFPTVYYPLCFFLITVSKENEKILYYIVIVDHGGQKNRNGKSSSTNYQRMDFSVEQGRVVTTLNIIKH